MKLLLSNNRLRFRSPGSAKMPARLFAVCSAALMIVGIAGCGTPEPPEIDESLRQEIVQEDEAVIEGESDL